MESLTVIIKALQAKFAEREKANAFGELKVITIWRNGQISELRIVEESIHRPAAGTEPGSTPPVRRG